jgi:hypothetical protein
MPESGVHDGCSRGTYQVKQPVRTLGREARCHLAFFCRITSWLEDFISGTWRALASRKRKCEYELNAKKVVMRRFKNTILLDEPFSQYG